MSLGARITDEVEYYRRTGQFQQAVRVIRNRKPERLRWRMGVAALTQIAGTLRGRERMRIEEPVREMVLELPDRLLRRETVLDARRNGVDLDRGEVLPQLTRWDLRRSAFLIGVDQRALSPYILLPNDYAQPIDTAAAVLVSRAFAAAHKARADRLLEAIPTDVQQNWEQRLALPRYQQYRIERAERDRDLAGRWNVLAKVLVEGVR